MPKTAVSAQLKKKIEALVQEHLHGGAFWNEFKAGFHKHAQHEPEEDVAELDGSAYGLYIKKSAKRSKAKKGSGLLGATRNEVARSAPMASDVIREIGSGLPKARGRPKKEGKKKRAFDPDSKTARRAKVVKEVMQKQGLSLIDASKFVKAKNIPY